MKKRIFLNCISLLLVLVLLTGCSFPVITETSENEVSIHDPATETNENDTSVYGTTNGTETEDPAEDNKSIMAFFPEFPYPMPAGWLTEELKNYRQLSLEQLPVHSKMWIETEFGWPFFFRRNNSVIMILDNLKYWFGLDHVTVLDEDHICTVTNFVNEYTGQQKYVYAVFERELYNEGGETWEKWRYHFEYYCVTRALSSKDFADVAVGDSMKKLLAIEPGIEMFYGKNKYDISLYIGSEFLLMLEDGLLYVQHTHSEDPIITELEFHPWGEPVTVFETEAFMAVAPNRPPLPSS